MIPAIKRFLKRLAAVSCYVALRVMLCGVLALQENVFTAYCCFRLQKMGLPDLPGQPEDDSAFTMDENNTVHLEPLSEDESDNESMDANGYAGYQPLNMDELNHPNRRPSLMEDEAESGVGEGESVGLDGANNSINADFLNVDVWNAPRPNELNIELDSSKAAEVRHRVNIRLDEFERD